MTSFAAGIIENIVPIRAFSRGGAAKAFAKARTSKPVIVTKNNEPVAIVTTPEEYAYLTEIEEDYELLCMALERLERHEREGGRTYSREEVMAELGITEADLDAIPDEEVEFE